MRGGSCGCVLKASSVMGVAMVVFLMRALVLWCSCRRVSGVMCTFRWLSEQKT